MSSPAQDLRQAIRCLAFEVPAPVWDDVNTKVEAVLAENAQLRRDLREARMIRIRRAIRVLRRWCEHA